MDDYLSAGIGLANTSLQIAAAAVGQADSESFIRKENQKAREFQLEMWNKANEYNMPSAVMARLQAAGLNPNLVYGNGAESLAGYVSAPGHSAPNMNYGQLYQNAINSLMQTAVAKSTIDMQHSQAYKNYQEGDKAKEEARQEAVTADISERNVDVLENILYNSANKLYHDGQISEEQRFLIEQQSRSLFYDNKVTEEASAREFSQPISVIIGSSGKKKYVVSCNNGLEVMIANKVAEWQKYGISLDSSMEFINKTFSEIKLNEIQQQKVVSDIEVNNAEIAFKRTLSSLNQAQIQKIYSDMSVNNAVIKELQTRAGVNYQTAQKLYTEAWNAIQNGTTERWKTTTRDRYGSGVVNSILNAIYNEVTNRGKVYFNDKTFTPKVYK